MILNVSIAPKPAILFAHVSLTSVGHGSSVCVAPLGIGVRKHPAAVVCCRALLLRGQCLRNVENRSRTRFKDALKERIFSAPQDVELVVGADPCTWQEEFTAAGLLKANPILFAETPARRGCIYGVDRILEFIRVLSDRRRALGSRVASCELWRAS